MTTTLNFLPQIEQAAPNDKLPLVRRFMQESPLPFFKELREHQPILVLPECVLVAKYDDVIELLNMPTIFTVALYKPKMEPSYLMSHDDDALHYREKSLMQSLLNRDDLPKVRAMVQQIAQQILKKSHGKINAVTDYCRAVPTGIVQQYFGLIGIKPSKLMEWSYWAQVDTFYNQPFDLTPPEQSKKIIDSHNQSGKELGEYITALMIGKSIELKLHFVARLWQLVCDQVRSWMGKPTPFHDDIVSRMLRCGFPKEMEFNIKRVGVNAGGLLIGTIETTAQASVQALQYLLQNPEILDSAKRAALQHDPSEFDAIVWEALRFVPISPYMFRQTASDYTIAKGSPRATAIPANTNVLALTQSAMFDEKAFEEPDRFIPNRNWYHYFTFGYGSHECLGKYVGMVMIPEMVKQLLLLPNALANGQIEYEGHMPSRYTFEWTV